MAFDTKLSICVYVRRELVRTKFVEIAATRNWSRIRRFPQYIIWTWHLMITNEKCKYLEVEMYSWLQDYYSFLVLWTFHGRVYRMRWITCGHQCITMLFKCRLHRNAYSDILWKSSHGIIQFSFLLTWNIFIKPIVHM